MSCIHSQYEDGLNTLNVLVKVGSISAARVGQLTNDILVPFVPGSRAYLLQIPIGGGLVFHTMEYHHPAVGYRPYPAGIATLQAMLAPAVGALNAIFAPVRWALVAIDANQVGLHYLGIVAHISFNLELSLNPVPGIFSGVPQPPFRHKPSVRPKRALWKRQEPVNPNNAGDEQKAGSVLCLAPQNQAYRSLEW